MARQGAGAMRVIAEADALAAIPLLLFLCESFRRVVQEVQAFREGSSLLDTPPILPVP